MQILNGKEISRIIKEEIAAEVRKYIGAGYRAPHLAAVLVGDDGASRTYVNSKVRACEKAGIKSSLILLEKTVTQEELLKHIAALNADDTLDGFIVQLPLPSHIDEQEIITAISPEKDVDGFHPQNIGKMTLDLPGFLPATPYGIIELLERYRIETAGKHVVVIGRSRIVGRPVSILMSQKRPAGNATVTLTHSGTSGLENYIRQADILIVAMGKPEFITGEMIKEGAVVVDVGIHRIPDEKQIKGYRITGDVHYESAVTKAAYITPVPGGVGPMTIAMLLKNTLSAYKKRMLKL